MSVYMVRISIYHVYMYWNLREPFRPFNITDSVPTSSQ